MRTTLLECGRVYIDIMIAVRSKTLFQLRSALNVLVLGHVAMYCKGKTVYGFFLVNLFMVEEGQIIKD